MILWSGIKEFMCQLQVAGICLSWVQLPFFFLFSFLVLGGEEVVAWAFTMHLRVVLLHVQVCVAWKGAYVIDSISNRWGYNEPIIQITEAQLEDKWTILVYVRLSLGLLLCLIEWFSNKSTSVIFILLVNKPISMKFMYVWVHVYMLI